MKLVHVNAYSSRGRRVRSYTQMRQGAHKPWKPVLKGQIPNSDRGGPRKPLKGMGKSILAPVGTPWVPKTQANTQVQTPMRRRRKDGGSVARPRRRAR